MGKLAGLLGSGIGLAMETAAYQSSSSSSDIRASNRRSSRNSHGGIGCAASDYGARGESSSYRNVSEESCHSSDSDTAIHDVKRYADFQKSLADKSRHGSGNKSPNLSAASLVSPSLDVLVSYSSETWGSGSLRRSLLDRPAIIPQRRPEDKSRGWVRAYPPALVDYGIDENSFLRFLDSYNEKCKASPYLDVVNIAAFGVGFAPGIAPMVVSMVVPAAVRMAKTSQTNSQSASFLANANATLFAPHGLYAMIMTYKPDQISQTLTVDTSALPYLSVRDLGGVSKDRSAPESHLPPSAELIFSSPASQLTDYENNKFLKLSHFVADYADRRAQARYANNNPNSSLVIGPQPRFRSRWGDPNHPANNGGLISLISGRVKDVHPRDQIPDERKEGDKRRRRNNKGSRFQGGILSKAVETAMTGKNGMGGTERPRLIGGIKRAVSGSRSEDQSLLKGLKPKTVQSDIIYLMIVDNASQNKNSTAFRSVNARSVASTTAVTSSEYDHDSRARAHELDGGYAPPPSYEVRLRRQSYQYANGGDFGVPTL